MLRFIFKCRIQEYTQKAGLPIPVYQTIKEGPGYLPSFRSNVVVDNICYHSRTAFSNRKAAEQSAAEVALAEIAKTGALGRSASHPVHETGLCKNLLQAYAHKMNYGLPTYLYEKHEKKGKENLFSCTVEFGGIKYTGGAANSKKEAEAKAVKTTLLAIKMCRPNSESKHTMMSLKRKDLDPVLMATEDEVNTKRKKTSGDFVGVKENDSNLDGTEVNDSNVDGNEGRGGSVSVASDDSVSWNGNLALWNR